MEKRKLTSCLYSSHPPYLALLLLCGIASHAQLLGAFSVKCLCGTHISSKLEAWQLPLVFDGCVAIRKEGLVPGRPPTMVTCCHELVGSARRAPITRKLQSLGAVNIRASGSVYSVCTAAWPPSPPLPASPASVAAEAWWAACMHSVASSIRESSVDGGEGWWSDVAG